MIIDDDNVDHIAFSCFFLLRLHGNLSAGLVSQSWAGAIPDRHPDSDQCAARAHSPYRQPAADQGRALAHFLDPERVHLLRVDRHIGPLSRT
jgi:hypothetical protein